jgi:hypothetical protein
VTKSRHQHWSRQFDNLATEVSRLCIACDIPMFEEGIGIRVLKGDDRVCGRTNPHVFEPGRKHVWAFGSIVAGAITRLGADEVRPMLDEIFDAVAQLRGTERPGRDSTESAD